MPFRLSARRSVQLLLAVILLGAVPVCFRLRTTPPGEKALFREFHAKRPLYERLRNMLLADENVQVVFVRSGTVRTMDGMPQPPDRVQFSRRRDVESVGRHGEYVRLLEELGAKNVFRDRATSGDICVTVWASGFAGNTRHVWVCSLASPPRVRVASLDEIYRSPKPRHSAYRHIEGDWYLSSDW